MRHSMTGPARRLGAAMLAAAFLLAAPPTASAEDDPERLVARAKAAYLEVMTDPKRQIPYTIMRRALAVGIFPRVTKAGLVIGGTGGDGVILARRGSGWTGPSFHRLSAASIGAQIGAQRAAVFLLVMNERALRAIMREETTLAGDAAAVAGPDSASAGDVDLERAGVITYWRAKGAFLGATLEGAEVSQEHKLTRRYYGRSLSAETILNRPENVEVPASGMLLRQFMEHSPQRNLVGAVQLQLAERGYYRNGIDGVTGNGTRAAILKYQSDQALPASGRATQPLLDYLRAEER